MLGIVLRFAATVVAVPLAALIFPGVHAAGSEIAWIAGIAMGLVYLLLRPVIRLLLTPLRCLTLGLAGFLIDSGLVFLAGRWMVGFAIDGFVWALATALLISCLRELLSRMAHTA